MKYFNKWLAAGLAAFTILFVAGCDTDLEGLLYGGGTAEEPMGENGDGGDHSNGGDHGHH